jgi:hypothetical protein
VKTLDVSQTLPAPPMMAAWLRSRLDPVIAVCRFANAIPLELRPTGEFSGWCGPKSYYRDGRVCMSSQIIFWRPDQILAIYLHECAHRLLSGREVSDHGPEFLALTAALYIRASSNFEKNAVDFLKLYDIQDVERPYKGEVLNWALRTAESLAAVDKSAESLADEVCKLWVVFVSDKEANEAKKIVQARALIDLKNKVLQINSRLFLSWAVAFVGWAGLFASLYFSVIR